MTEDEQKKVFSRNLNRYIDMSNKTQREIAHSIGVSPQTFNTWCQGIAIPRMGKVQRLADYFHIGKSDLIDDKPLNPPQSTTKGVAINVLGRVAAGLPIEAVENIIDTEEISEALARTGDFFGLQIHGDSMEPRIYDGDVVIVRQQEDAESGEIVIALINGDDAVCKRLSKYAGGLSLISLNSKYDPLIFSNDEIASRPVRIIGKVVELRGKL